MTRELLDKDSFEGSIANNGSETLTVNTSRANDILILLDDGTVDAQPAQYTLTQRVRQTSFGQHQFYDEVTAETSRSWVDGAWGESMEFEFTNTSGASASYRISVESYSEMG